MRKRFKFKSIRTRLTFWLFIIAICSMVVVNIAIYTYVVNSLKISIYHKLEAIRDLKVNELNHWLDERIIDIRTIAAADELRGLDNFQKDRESSRRVIRRYLQLYDEFHEISLVSPSTKEVLVSTNMRLEGKEFPETSYFEDAFRSANLHIRDIYFSSRLNKPSMAFCLPVFSSREMNHAIGILVGTVDPESSLYSLLSNRIGIGETGETLLVNRNVIALNELRWHRDAVLQLKIDSRPAVDASRGKTGIAETADYRGERVLAAHAYIPRTGWGFVAKQDLKEVYTPIYQMRNWMLVIGIITLIGVIIVAFSVSQSISNPIKALHRGSEIIGKGNLNHRVGTDARDEIGQLSRIIDQMMENLRTTTASRDDLNREIAERKHLEKMLLEIREHERRRIGHDLHDNLGQQLTAISFKTQALENMLRKRMIPEAEDAARIKNLVEMSKAQVKSLSSGLSPMLDKDEYCLMTAMVELASNASRMFSIRCSVSCSEVVPIYNRNALIHLYRIAQEAITNAARHAKPEKVEICLVKKDNELVMTIQDDGTGIAFPNQNSGMGLEIMRHRAVIINASLDIQPAAGRGTIVTCTFHDMNEKEMSFA